jgi:leucyl-tRNA synthetase
MPISAAAKKLKLELDAYGNPPVLPPLPANSDQKYQYDIMRQLGLTPEQIPDFIDANHWVRYFPPLGR